MHSEFRSAFFLFMTVNKVIKHIEEWAPKEIAWERDNVGLQVGSLNRRLKNIMLCLEITEGVINESIKNKCNFIFSHHPLLFRSLKKIDTDKDKNSIIVEKLLKNNITLYSAHTNLDFTKDGVSFQLAKKIKLNNIKFLVNLKSNQYKVIVFVPQKNVEELSHKIFECGGGIIGEYKNCSFRINGEGTFKGSKNTNPHFGSKNKSEKVDEIRLEVIVNKWNLNSVIETIKENHPYEEPAFDVYPLENDNLNYGAGAIGNFERSLSVNKFLNNVKKLLNLKNFRYVKGSKKNIKKVAVCGGSCSELIKDAINKGADAFITADIKYHDFHDADGKILLIDAGHYETEIHSLKEVQLRLKKFLSDNNKIKVFKYSGSTNPIIFYNN